MTLTHSLERACEGAAAWLRGLRGWRRLGAAFLSGLLSAFAFAPFALFPLLLLSFAVLVMLLDGAHDDVRPMWRAAVIGWAYGFGQFLGGLYWVAYAFLVDPLGHAWQIPFVALIFPGGLALFIAGATAVAASLWRDGPSRIFAFTVTYTLAEWLRGHVLTGFPWNIPGYGWGASAAVLQSVSLFGVYGLSLLTVLFGASLALLCERGRWRLIPAALATLFVVFWIGGAVRLAFSPAQTVAGVRLRLVQPNVPQAEKYLPTLRVAHWHQLLGLSIERKGAAPTHIIWPEAAPPFLLEHVPQALADIRTLTDHARILMTGGARAEYGADGKLVAHNSFYIFGYGGALLARYDKFHLVPFGEYVPFPETLHALGIDRLVNQPGSFASGDGPHAYGVPGAPPVGPLICYEILFPAAVVGERRPAWFVNVTDDSWFGPASSSGPYQHFLTARVRAIEEGIPVARAANTGISAVIDPLGRVIAQLGVDKAGVVDAPLPEVLSPTVYGRLHDLLFWAMFGLCLIAGLLVRRQSPSAP